ncbi:MAG: DUF559 domain-containing protein [Thermoplasmatales archaeon]
MGNNKNARDNKNAIRKFKSSSPFTSKRMKRVKSVGTKLEMAMENILVEAGISYAKQPKLRGHPDFELRGTSILIFCDSSFWHGRNQDDVSGRNFKRNKKLWVEKLTKTRERDKKINEYLKGQGYVVLRFWDDEILKSPEEVKRVILTKKSQTQ